MSAVLEKLTIEEYLERERKSDTRTEYTGGVERKMTGASYIHNKIVINIIKSISSQIKSPKWEVLTSDMKVWVPSKDSFYYPDVLILPSPPQFYDNSKDIITNPAVIFEVLSDSTRNFDKGEKFDTYRSIPAFQEYYLVEQNKKLVTQYLQNTKGNWEMIEYKDSSSSLAIQPMGIHLNLSEIYEGIEL